MRRILAGLICALLLGSEIVAQDPSLRPRWGRDPLVEEDPLTAIITLPTTAPTFSTSNEIVTIQGQCNHSMGCTEVTWACASCATTSGTASGTASWSFSVDLASGANTIVVTPHNAAMDTPVTDQIVITFSAGDVDPPVVMITTPTASTTDTVTGSPYSIGGTATDGVGVTQITWSNSATPGSGNATGTTDWTASIPLTNGSNPITITGQDAAGNQGTDMITVTLLIPLVIDQTTMPVATEGVSGSRQLTATGGAGGNAWDNNGAGTTLNDSDADCAGTSMTVGGLVQWSSAIMAGTCSFTARVEDDDMNVNTQMFTFTIVEAGAEGAHDFFNEFSVDATALLDNNGQAVSRSMRTCCGSGTDLEPNGIMGNKAGGFTYDSSQDAAKLLWDQSWKSIPNSGAEDTVIDKHLGVRENSSFIFVWDAWWGPEWRSVSCGGKINISGTGNDLVHKEFRVWFLTTTEALTNNGHIAIEIQTWYVDSSNAPYAGDCDHVALLAVRTYQTGQGTGVSPNSNALQPTGPGAYTYKTYKIRHSTWTRFWLKLDMNVSDSAFDAWETWCACGAVQAGTYHGLSLWAADENRDPERIYYNVPTGRVNGATTRDGLSRWMIEMNTSTNHVPASGYLTFTGSPGGSIPNGTVVQRDSDGKRYFTQTGSNTSVQLPGSGTADIFSTAVPSTAGGPIGNTSQGTAMNLVETITNVDDPVSAATAFTGGRYFNDGDLVMYFRDLVALENYSLPATPEDDTTLFRKPVR